jgi:hypothetical protein
MWGHNDPFFSFCKAKFALATWAEPPVRKEGPGVIAVQDIYDCAGILGGKIGRSQYCSTKSFML